MARPMSISLKEVVPIIPNRAEEKAMLEEDLQRMGCHGIMECLWCLKYKKVMVELQQARDNRWLKTLCQDPNKWIAAAWHKVYNFSIHGEGMVMRGEKFVKGIFFNPPHPKDGYALPDCKDPRAKRMLEFLIPIFYPEKPARVIVTIENMMLRHILGNERWIGL